MFLCRKYYLYRSTGCIYLSKTNNLIRIKCVYFRVRGNVHGLFEQYCCLSYCLYVILTKLKKAFFYVK